MERFLRYSLEKGRKIRAMLMQGGQLVQRTLLVLAMEEDGITAQVGAKKASVHLNFEDILSCDYARGDHGEE